VGAANSELLAQQAKNALDRETERKRDDEREAVANTPKFQNEKVWLPNALGINVRPFLEARARIHKKQNEIFDNPATLMKEAKKDCHYGWARTGAPITVLRAAQGAYRYVKNTEIKAGLAEMFTNHKGTSGEKVCHGSLVLIEIPEQAWNDYFIEPEIEAVARLASQQAQLAASIDEHSEGRARLVSETSTETERLV
jgi:hypothetical protein